LPEALALAMADGLAFVILDGKVIPASRCQEKATSVTGESPLTCVFRQGPPPWRQYSRP